MLVKQLLEDLKNMDPEAAVGFVGNGTWPATGIEYGKVVGQSRGYVLLFSTMDKDPAAHSPLKKK